ncbi:hypothetical protein [Isoptericola sp. BMS4]|uniref:hypothetical protein n=1 Tax=Isoptericola sp. BMS4 TaxID=2527875 RepID=UPI00141EB8B0|nr:hypothetical protein [Isoptericola sp. BMS4]
MLAVNGPEVVMLTLWVLGVVGAVYGAADPRGSTVRRAVVVLVAVLVPVVGSLVGLASAVVRSRRGHRAGSDDGWTVR